MPYESLPRGYRETELIGHTYRSVNQVVPSARSTQEMISIWQAARQPTRPAASRCDGGLRPVRASVDHSIREVGHGAIRAFLLRKVDKKTNGNGGAAGCSSPGLDAQAVVMALLERAIVG